MTMGLMSGVSINHSLDVSNNLQVHGVCTFNGNVSVDTLTVGGANIGEYDFITQPNNYVDMSGFSFDQLSLSPHYQISTNRSYSADAGVNTGSTDFIAYAVPPGAETCYIQQQAWNAGG